MTISFKKVLWDVRREHKTDKYKSEDLIVRRGFPVRLETTATSLTIRLVPAHPRNRVDLRYSFVVAVNKPQNGWSLQGPQSGYVTLSIPPNAPVGMYSVEVRGGKISMAVLFNPYSKQDEVYLESESERNEYVLNDYGRIWVGSSDSPYGMPWTFAQFRMTSMLIAMHFLDRMPAGERHDPVRVSRHLSASVNSQDDNGVLAGRWDGRYGDGTSPSAWTGSAEILKQYYETLRPVRYGQCWVFSGVFTTVMRALGLSSRSVTNFLSAHDTTKPYNRAVDKFYDSEGRPLENMSNDSTWNFHVWNECWMRRPDLHRESRQHGLKYDGWQILDATPQEESSGLYQLGPAPLTAIKYGFTLNYDTDFVIGEVNADVIHYWRNEGSNNFEVRAKYSRYIGQKISTKAVGADSRKDVTLDYKFPEGSKEERASLANRSSARVEPKPEPATTVEFKTTAPADVKVGEPIKFVLTATNNGTSKVRVRFNCLYRATDYTGTPRARIGSSDKEITVQPRRSGDYEIVVQAQQYEPYLGNGVQTIQFNSSGKVVETGQVWSMENIVRVNAHDTLRIRAPERVTIGTAASASAVITNTSTMTLTNVVLRAEGEGLLDLTALKLANLKPGETVKKDIPLKPSEAGDRLLVTTLDTDELKDISRSAHILVVAAASRPGSGTATTTTPTGGSPNATPSAGEERKQRKCFCF